MEYGTFNHKQKMNALMLNHRSNIYYEVIITNDYLIAITLCRISSDIDSSINASGCHECYNRRITINKLSYYTISSSLDINICLIIIEC